MTADVPKEAGELPQDDKVDDLDAVLSAALDGSEAPDTPIDRTRDERGRFAPTKAETEGGTDAATAAAEVTETAPDPKAQPVAAPAQSAAAQWTDGHFTGWKPEQRERFNALPPDVQKLVMDRQAESQAFYQRKQAEHDEFRKVSEPLVRAASEVEPFARSIGMSADELMRNYAALDYQLRYAPYQQKVKLLGEIAASYGLPYAPPEADPYADPLQPNGQAYPVIHDLQSQLQRQKSELAALKAQAEAQEAQRFEAQVHAFATATNADGSPKHPLAEVVWHSMGQLLQSGKAPTLEAAYALAVQPIEKRLAEQQQQAVSAQAQVIARAKKATPIRTSGIAPGGKTKGGLDDVLDATLTQAGYA